MHICIPIPEPVTETRNWVTEIPEPVTRHSIPPYFPYLCYQSIPCISRSRASIPSSNLSHHCYYFIHRIPRIRATSSSPVFPVSLLLYHPPYPCYYTIPPIRAATSFPHQCYFFIPRISATISFRVSVLQFHPPYPCYYSTTYYFIPVSVLLFHLPYPCNLFIPGIRVIISSPYPPCARNTLYIFQPPLHPNVFRLNSSPLTLIFILLIIVSGPHIRPHPPSRRACILYL